MISLLFLTKVKVFTLVRNSMTARSTTAWKFYGRSPELDKLTAILRRNRWFFGKITGRRRIGKTTLV